MKPPDIAHLRLVNQRISGGHLRTPEEVVAWLGAVQAQDFASARWAVALRMKNGSDQDVARAYNEGRILRTHILRPTWHLVAREDLRWMLALSAPQVRKIFSYYCRRAGISEATCARSNELIAGALRGGKFLTRLELAAMLRGAGILEAKGTVAAFLMGRAEIDGVVCSGPMRGKKFTYALLDERVGPAEEMARDDALVALAGRYFNSRGPATLEDFMWWSGLSQKDARIGSSRQHPALQPQVIEGRVHWFPSAKKSAASDVARAYLLPMFDEYSIGYTDRSALFDVTRLNQASPTAQQQLWSMMVINGRMIGTWKRTILKNEVLIETRVIGGWNEHEKSAIVEAAKEYGAFLGLPVRVDVSR